MREFRPARFYVVAPFGGNSKEGGLMYLLANYLQNVYSDVRQLQCNGIFSVCDRDAEVNWRRDLRTCVECIAGQKRLSAWAGIEIDQLSHFLHPHEVEATKRWLLELDPGALLEARYEDIDVFSRCRWSFQNRFGAELPDLSNKQHERGLRQLLLAAVRMAIAARSFARQARSSAILLADGRDFISCNLLHEMKRCGAHPVIFQWDINSRAVHIIHSRTQERYACELMLSDVTSTRSDVDTWPGELVTIVSDILQFLEISDTQLELPIAQ